jgi:hypothetical protein
MAETAAMGEGKHDSSCDSGVMSLSLTIAMLFSSSFRGGLLGWSFEAS